MSEGRKIAGTNIIDPASLPPKPALEATPPPLQGPKNNPATQNLTTDLARILRPQAAYRWLLPQLAAITPQYVEMTLRGALAGNHVQAWELFDLMLDSWPELAAVTQELTESVQRKALIFEPYAEEGEKPTDEAVERCKVVSAALRNMRPDPSADENDLDGTIKDILSAWFLGTAVLEISWDQGNGSDALNIVTTSLGGEESQIIGPRSTFWVHPVCYAWSMNGTVGLRTELGMIRATTTAAKKREWSETGGSVWNSTAYQPRPTSVDNFPPNKFLIGISKGKSGTALGGARLRALAFWWCASNFSAEWLMNLAQLFGLPIRWANYDLNAPQETIDAVCTMLENMGSAGWGAFPAGTNLQLHESKNSGDHSPQGELLDRADRYARSLVLGQTMTGSRRGMQGGGGPGFGGVEKDVKDDRIDAAGKFACGVINQQFIPAILMVNYGDATQSPTCKLLDKNEGALPDAQRDTTLAQGGLKIGVNYLRSKYGIPAPESGEETIGGHAKPGPTALRAGNIPPDGSNQNDDDPESQLDSRHPGCRHDAVELRARGGTGAHAIANKALEDLTGVSSRWLGGVRPFFDELIAKAQDEKLSDADFVTALNQAQKQIPELFAKLQPAHLQTALANAMGAALVNGMASGHVRQAAAGHRSPPAERNKLEEVA